ncbi:MAG TPA: hypothetical protein VMU50_04890, partial [Polyangia bacterium]|nr:hypothetical protein [Polyangia bacterium]
MRRFALGLLLFGIAAREGFARADAALPEPEPARLTSVLLSPPPATSALPKVHWHTLETPHFRIHFYDEERALADRAAPIAERAHRLVTRYLN